MPKRFVGNFGSIKLGGKVVGQSMSGSYINGPPVSGKCWAVGCSEQATDETLLGVLFCKKHLSAWYSDKPCPFMEP